jgi:hypothetical protein
MVNKTLTIRGKVFNLPFDVEYYYNNESMTTHLFFNYNNETQFKNFVNSILQYFEIKKFGHDLGIVFSDMQIFSYGELPKDIIYNEEKNNILIDENYENELNEMFNFSFVKKFDNKLKIFIPKIPLI